MTEPAGKDFAGSNAVLRLALELWVVKDRQFALERVLEGQGLNVQTALANWAPTVEDKALLDAQRTQFIAAVVEALRPTGGS